MNTILQVAIFKGEQAVNIKVEDAIEARLYENELFWT